MERLHNVQVLRGVAVLSVCLYHFFPGFFTGGFAGVDVFFVLSGFFVANMLEASTKRGISDKEIVFSFYKRRIKRLIPAFVVVVLLTIVFAYLIFLPEDFNAYTHQLLSAVFFVSNFYFWSEAGYFDTVSISKPLLHTWSLGVEVQFYLLFPVVYVVIRKFSARLRLGVIFLLALLSFLFGLSYLSSDASQAFYNPFLRFWEILAGVLLFIYYKKTLGYSRVEQARGNMFLYMGIIFLVIIFFFLSKDSFFPGYYALCVVLITMVCVATSFSFSAKKGVGGVLSYFGDISYSLYLVHWPVVVFATYLSGGPLSSGLGLLYISLSILIAHAIYAYVEKRVGKSSLLNQNAIAYAFSVTVIAIVSLIYTTGLRSDSKIQELIENPRPAVVNYGCEKLMDPISKQEFSGGCWLSGNDPENLWIGDSHMAMYRPVIWDKFKHESNMMLVEHYCFPFASNHSFRGDCLEKFNSALDFIDRSTSVKTIYITGYWSYLMTGGSGEEGLRWRRSLPIIKDVADGFKTNAVQFFERVNSSGKRIVFIKDVPDLNFDIQQCVVPLPILSLNKSNQNCDLSKADFMEYSKPYNSVIDDLLDRYPSVEILDPIPALCQSNSCRSMDNGLPLYENGDHLNIVGAKVVFDYFFK